jgi:hypothetical protein
MGGESSILSIFSFINSYLVELSLISELKSKSCLLELTGDLSSMSETISYYSIVFTGRSASASFISFTTFSFLVI